MARKRIARISTPEQLRVAAAPATYDVLEAIQVGGPVTAAQLGPRLGRKANSLHFHIRKLVGVGLVRQVDTRRSGARTEVVYDVIADSFVGHAAPVEAKMRQATNDTVASMLRLATRNYARASERPREVTQSGPHRNLVANRHKAWLTKRELAEVNGHLNALTKIFSNQHRTHHPHPPARGTLFAINLVLTPLELDD